MDSKSRGPCGRVGSTPTSGINEIDWLSNLRPVRNSLAFLFFAQRLSTKFFFNFSPISLAY